MRVFVTGATGFIGSAVVEDLLKAGHQVLGMTRSDAGAKWLRDAGAEVHRADLDDLDSIRSGVANAEGVIHTAFNHDFSKYIANCEADRLVIEALGSALAGSDRPLVVTSGTGMAQGKSGQPSTEEDVAASSAAVPRAASEEAADSVAAKGVHVSIVRLPQVHDTTKAGLVTYAIEVARQTGVSAYMGDGSNRWPASHRLDTATLYRLVLEKGAPGARYHAVDEEGVPMREIAEVLGQGLNVPVVSKTPEEAAAHFGWLGIFAGLDLPSSSARTRADLGWHPTQSGLIADLEEHDYRSASVH